MSEDGMKLDATRFEKLGSFYLGRELDPEDFEHDGPPLLYDARDLTTHAVAVGMTGSGKTGLCLSLLEEAALDGIPAIAIDPKGDLGNLLLTFPNLSPTDFRPWVDESRAAREGLSVDELAVKQAEVWKNGLASWGQDGKRIAALRDAVDLAIYTPGATHGLPLAALRSLAAPGAPPDDDPDGFRARVSSTVSALLALSGRDADPLQSREHILLSHIVEAAWRAGRNLDLEGLIRSVQAPGFDRVGVLELDSFYPEDDRFELAMRLNNLIAAPGFGAWLEGDPLDIKSLLWTSEGQPRISILSISHLGDAERMFLVTLVLNELLAWIRTRPGAASLRAILYMDEVFGYLPPTRMPPSKQPLLALLKQARAFGLGIVLATQNPVDLDYKALSNAGTWFLGRLQTERDKLRVMDGLDGAAAFAGAGLDRREMDRILAGLQSRTFLLNNVHEEGPVLFRTRWAMSYLRGPLARPEIRRLMSGRLVGRDEAAGGIEGGSPRPVAAVRPGPRASGRPLVRSGVDEVFLAGSARSAERRVYRPALYAEADLHYSRAALGVDVWRRVACLAPLEEDTPPDPWSEAAFLETAPELTEAPDPEASFEELPSAASRPASYRSWKSALKGHLYQHRTVEIRRCRSPKLVSELDESETDFQIRLREALREKRDEALDRLRKKYGTRRARLDARVQRATAKMEREKSQESQQKMQTAISVGATVLDALLGRKGLRRGTLGRATTAVRGAGRAARERDDVRRAQDALAAARDELQALELEMEGDTAELQAAFTPDSCPIETVAVRPRKGDLVVHRVALAWTPWRVSSAGIAEPDWD